MAIAAQVVVHVVDRDQHHVEFRPTRLRTVQARDQPSAESEDDKRPRCIVVMRTGTRSARIERRRIRILACARGRTCSRAGNAGRLAGGAAPGWSHRLLAFCRARLVGRRLGPHQTASSASGIRPGLRLDRHDHLGVRRQVPRSGCPISTIGPASQVKAGKLIIGRRSVRRAGRQCAVETQFLSPSPKFAQLRTFRPAAR